MYKGLEETQRQLLNVSSHELRQEILQLKELLKQSQNSEAHIISLSNEKITKANQKIKLLKQKKKALKIQLKSSKLDIQ